MAGTSTGAIICAGLAIPGDAMSPKFKASDIVEHYKTANIFQKKNMLITKSLYDPAPLANLLQKLCGTVLLKDLLSHVVIPAVRDKQTELYVFSRQTALEYHTSLKVYDVVRASSAAPVYFPEHKFPYDGEEASFFDGGLKCNNPTQHAMEHAERRFPQDNLTLLSLGTGFCSLHPNSSSHGPLWWGVHPAAASEMAGLCCNADDVHSMMLRKSYGKGNLEYIRKNVPLSRAIDLADDSQQSIDNLVDLGHGFIEEAYASEDNWFNKLVESLKESSETVIP
jgi:hypothetical protein